METYGAKLSVDKLFLTLYYIQHLEIKALRHAPDKATGEIPVGACWGRNSIIVIESNSSVSGALWAWALYKLEEMELLDSP